MKNMAADKIQVLFDLNIILDVLQEREEFYDFSARLLGSVSFIQEKRRARKAVVA
jgi:hypothetical protein